MLTFTLPLIDAGASISEAVAVMRNSNLSGVVIRYPQTHRWALVNETQIGEAANGGSQRLANIPVGLVTPVEPALSGESGGWSTFGSLDSHSVLEILAEKNTDFGIVAARSGSIDVMSTRESFALQYLSPPTIRRCDNGHYYPPLSSSSNLCVLDDMPLH